MYLLEFYENSLPVYNKLGPTTIIDCSLEIRAAQSSLGIDRPRRAPDMDETLIDKDFATSENRPISFLAQGYNQQTLEA